MTPTSGKHFVLAELPLVRLRELAARWGYPIDDARLRASGVAKLLARKRGVTVGRLVDALGPGELGGVCDRLGIDTSAGAQGMRPRLAQALEGDEWRHLLRAARSRGRETEILPAELVEVCDGDTLRVRWTHGETLLRLRGVDTPECSESDKAEEELDRSRLDPSVMKGLGHAAAAWLHQHLAGRRLYLHCERTPAGPKLYLHHRQYRLLAYVALDSPDGPDLGELLLAHGYALVWPRSVVTRRYLHPRSLAYVVACNGALNARPGLWNRGLERLCPSHAAPHRTWSLEDCKSSCFRADWFAASGEGTTHPAGAARGR